MTSKHDLAHEFPEMKEEIHALKMKDRHFLRLFNEHEALTKELHRADEGAGSISDGHAEDLKKKRLELKDKLYALLKAAAGEGG